MGRLLGWPGPCNEGIPGCPHSPPRPLGGRGCTKVFTHSLVPGIKQGAGMDGKDSCADFLTLPQFPCQPSRVCVSSELEMPAPCQAPALALNNQGKVLDWLDQPILPAYLSQSWA